MMANESSKTPTGLPFLRQKNESGWCILVMEPRGLRPRKGGQVMKITIEMSPSTFISVVLILATFALAAIR
jgi:hypothetical protein